MTTRSRVIGLAAVAIGAALVARRVAARWRLVRAVPADMRSPFLWMPAALTSPGFVRLSRHLPVPPGRVADGVEATRREVPGPAGSGAMPVWVYDTPGRQHRTGAVLWIHGGGFVQGDPVVDHPFCSRLAGELGVPVVSVGYRLAPEHPFPAPLDDCGAALLWLHASADELGVDRSRIAVAGESAGAGLAAALAQWARDDGRVRPCFQLLVYPMLDDRTAADAPTGQTLVWTQRANRFGWSAYLGHPVDQPEHRSHAVPARTADLGGLPPAWIGVGNLDLFHDEDVSYAARLRDAGVECQLDVVPGMYHGALGLAPAGSSTANAFRAAAVGALGAALA